MTEDFFEFEVEIISKIPSGTRTYNNKVRAFNNICGINSDK